MSIRRIACLVLLVIGLNSAGSATELITHATHLDDLAKRADPREDDWQGESLQLQVAQRLAQLTEALAGSHLNAASLAKIASRRAQASTLRPQELRRVALGRGLDWFPYESSPKPGKPIPLLRALKQLQNSFGHDATPRIAAKVVGLELRPVDASAEANAVSEELAELETLVRYEAAVSRAQGLMQQVALWSVIWELPRGDDLGTEIAIRSIRLESFEELHQAQPMFEDLTASVLPMTDSRANEIQLGAEYWYSRLDAVAEPYLMGHQGLAVGDADGDGLQDLYVAMGTGLPNRLLRQRPDGTVADIADASGVAWLDDTKGVLFADTDNDGDQDLLSAIGATIVLAKNRGDGKFDRVVSLRASSPAAFYSISVADYDLDGDLDIYGTRYVQLAYGVSIPMPFHDANNGPPNHLLRNDGNDRFTDVTATSGLDTHNTRFSLAGVWADYDDDGDPDLYVTNDFGRNNLYRNDGGHFVDVAAQAGVEDQAAGMGASWSDYDLDGDLDLHVTNMFSAAGKRIAYQSRFQAAAPQSARQRMQRHALGNSLFANRGDGTFEDVSDVAGIRMGRWGWGARFVDLNNDGLDDIVAPNGFISGALEDDL